MIAGPKQRIAERFTARIQLRAHREILKALKREAIDREQSAEVTLHEILCRALKRMDLLAAIEPRSPR